MSRFGSGVSSVLDSSLGVWKAFVEQEARGHNTYVWLRPLATVVMLIQRPARDTAVVYYAASPGGPAIGPQANPALSPQIYSLDMQIPPGTMQHVNKHTQARCTPTHKHRTTDTQARTILFTYMHWLSAHSSTRMHYIHSKAFDFIHVYEHCSSTHTNTCLHAHTNKHTHIHKHTNTHTHTQTHTHTLKHTHTGRNRTLCPLASAPSLYINKFNKIALTITWTIWPSSNMIALVSVF